MKKKVLSVLLAASMISALLAGCGSTPAQTDAPAAEEAAPAEEEAAPAEAASAEEAPAAEGEAAAAGEGTFALVTKSAGNPYNEREAAGFEEAMKAMGYSDSQIIIRHPESATADAQITTINELISQNVSAIAIAANDMDALQPVCEQAASQGIKIISLDSAVNAASRMTHVNQAGTQIIGQTLMDAVKDLAGGEGQWAILSATSQASNQNAWIAAMKEVMEGEDYAGLELVEVAYGDDEYQKSVDQTQALLTNYPDLKVICAPTTVGIMAAAGVLQDKNSEVKLTGLGLPSEMADYIGTDNVCPYMYLWNPIDVGRLGAYTSVALVNGDITGAAGETFTAGEMGGYEIVEASDGGTEIIVGPPFAFTPENIDEWKSVY
ncbi:MAG: autoinducer 2 ABC transporter substrate-binding protein [Lachnospiraceae bacterium]|jgi:rhamnose transport system substrate-binding protein|nr:autoinducer 2 ABC transporter substrate-binding protein [Lachnospiraceae bacterium]